MYRVISTNILSGERTVHGDYESQTDVFNAISNFENYNTVHYCYNAYDGKEVFFHSLESNSRLNQKRQTSLLNLSFVCPKALEPKNKF